MSYVVRDPEKSSTPCTFFLSILLRNGFSLKKTSGYIAFCSAISLFTDFVQARKIRFLSEPSDEAANEDEDRIKTIVASLVSNEPSGRTMVALDDEGLLHWPVRLLYPEFGHSDLISAFNENTRLVGWRA